MDAPADVVAEFSPPDDLSTYTQVFNYGAMTMFNQQTPTTQDGILKSVSVYGKGLIKIYRITPNKQRFYLETIDLGLTDSVTTVNMTGSYFIKSGEWVGVSIVGSGNIHMKSPYQQGFQVFRTDTQNLDNFTLAYSYDLSIKSLPVITTDTISTLTDSFSIIYSDSFLTESAEWQKSGWDFNAGKYSSVLTGMENSLYLNKIWNIHKRFATIKIKPSSDTDFRIHLSSGKSNNTTSEGASMFSVNFSNNTLNIFGVLKPFDGDPEITASNIDTNYILKSVRSVPFVLGHEYEIEVRYHETIHQLKIKDLTTQQTATLEFNGWKAGRQQQSYGVYVHSGGSVELTNFVLSAVSGIVTLFVGDSTTEGVMVKDKLQRWWKLMQNQIIGKSEMSARGGHKTSDIISKFDNEIKMLNPDNLMILIGINNNGTPISDYTLLLNKCLDNGIRPIFNYMTCYNNGSHMTTLNNMLSAIPAQYLGYRFDIATSIDGGGVNYNPILFYDGLHPIESGCAKMAERLTIDKDDSNNSILPLV